MVAVAVGFRGNALQQSNSPAYGMRQHPRDAQHEERLLRAPAPEGAVGADDSGFVRVEIGRFRNPIRLDLHQKWPTAIKADALGASVMAAYHDAVGKQLEHARKHDPPAMELEEVSLHEKLRAYQSGSSRLPERHADDVVEAMFRANRSLADLTVARGRRAGRVHGPEGSMVRVQLDRAWLADCEIDPVWAAQRTVAQIMNEFSKALHFAREEAARFTRHGSPEEGEYRDALAQLGDLALEGLAALYWATESSSFPTDPDRAHRSTRHG